MEHIRKSLSSLAKTILTKNNFNVEPEPYILTPEEENTVILNAIEQKKKEFSYKYISKGMPQALVDEKMQGVDWLSKINREEILNLANSNKQYGIWQQEQREKEKREAIEKLEALKEIWTARTMLRLMRWTSEIEYGKKLIENQDTLPLIKTLCFFLSGDERFESELKLNPNKGLWIRGVSGLGKTHLVRCLAKNELNPIDIFSMIEIADEVKNEGEFNLPLDSKKIYLDDVGSEEATVNHYGTKINWFKDFLEIFYLRSQSYNKLLVSTNCGVQQIESLYGFRVRSRIKDMFNIIDVNGKDLRGL